MGATLRCGRRQRPLGLVTILVGAALGSCENGPLDPSPAGDPAIRSIAIAGPSSLVVGGAASLTAMAMLANGGTRDVTSSATWTSSNPDVATVSSGGIVSGHRTGEASIRAAIGGVSGAASMTVRPPPSSTPSWTGDLEDLLTRGGCFACHVAARSEWDDQGVVRRARRIDCPPPRSFDPCRTTTGWAAYHTFLPADIRQDFREGGDSHERVEGWVDGGTPP